MFFLYFKRIFLLKFIFIQFLILIIFWIFDLTIESISGLIIKDLKDFLKYSFLLFVFREIIFFFRIFWFFFDADFNQIIIIYENWLPKNIKFINPFSIPLINTFILLRRGFRITIFFINLLKNKKDFLRINFTIFLAILFLILQIEEYNEIRFSFSERIFRRSFFFSTGFHGIHVFFGLLFLIINYIRYYFLEFNKNEILSLEFSIIYWHFVDVVWLFLFLKNYYWLF
jgi:cytochrome c oxidase subunit 3